MFSDNINCTIVHKHFFSLKNEKRKSTLLLLAFKNSIKSFYHFFPILLFAKIKRNTRKKSPHFCRVKKQLKNDVFSVPAITNTTPSFKKRFFKNSSQQKKI